MTADATDKRLLRALAGGLPLNARPYAAVAAGVGISEEEVLARLARLTASGIIGRFGVVVRHHELGYNANAMAVWDVPDGAIAEIGRKISALPFVNLCYQRPRRLPEWPYNLFCMVHGRDRETVRQQIGEINRACALFSLPQAVLFSARRFKQRGAIYDAAVPEKEREVA
ncbi:MAG: Lrp/AsnC family transcriptional regulator [Rhodospirillales bacterium]|nr:Lrp/AsnC family transcriptional regulator [Rhodospirillales bacterium]